MPFVLNFVEFSLFQLIIFILRRALSIEETHKRTISNERYNTFCLVVPEFQTTNPYKNYKDCNAY